MAVAETLMHNYGVDSGAALEPGVVDVEVAADDPPRVRCLKPLFVAMTAAGDHDWAAARTALDDALTAGSEVTDTDLLGNLGNAALHLATTNQPIASTR